MKITLKKLCKIKKNIYFLIGFMIVLKMMNNIKKKYPKMVLMITFFIK